METQVATKEFFELSEWMFRRIFKDDVASKLALFNLAEDPLAIPVINAYLSNQIDYGRMQSAAGYFTLWEGIERMVMDCLKTVSGRTHSFSGDSWNHGTFCRHMELQSSSGTELHGDQNVEVAWFSIHHMAGVKTTTEELRDFLSGDTGVVSFDLVSHRIALIPCEDRKSMIVASGFFDIINSGYLISGDGKDRSSGGVVGVWLSLAKESLVETVLGEIGVFDEATIKDLLKIRSFVQEVESLTDSNGRSLQTYFKPRCLAFVGIPCHQYNHGFSSDSLLQHGFHGWKGVMDDNREAYGLPASFSQFRAGDRYALTVSRDWSGSYDLYLPL